MSDDALIGEFNGEDGERFALKSVAEAGLALRNRLERLEVTHGDVGLIFLTDADAKLIRKALLKLRTGKKEGTDRSHMNVLIEEMDLFVAGLEHEIQMGDGDDNDPPEDSWFDSDRRNKL